MCKLRTTLAALFVAGALTIASPCDAGQLYWIDTLDPDSIVTTDTDTFSPVDIIDDLGYEPRGFVVHGPSESMFWSRVGTENTAIWRANIDGSDRHVVGTANSWITSLSLDTVNEKLYWTRNDFGEQVAIERANFDFSDRETVLTLDQNKIGGLAVDPIGRKVYWATSITSFPSIKNIRRADLDGTDIEIIAEGRRFNSVVVDPFGQKVYWNTNDSDDRRVQRANLDGTDLEDILTDSTDFSDFPGYVHLPASMALDLEQEKLYWHNNQFRDDRLMRSSLDGSNIEQIHAFDMGESVRSINFPRDAGAVSADANGDGKVDALDYLLWAGNYGNDPAADPPGSPLNGDFNDDGRVDGFDYLLWAGDFGKGPNDSVAVPEPVSSVLLLLGLVACVGRRRAG